MEIRAAQWNGKNFDEMMKLMGENHGNKVAYENAEENALKTGQIYVKTEAGLVKAEVNDWVVMGKKGEFYLFNDENFKKDIQPLIEVTDREY